MQKVLLIEDSKTVITAISNYLARHGFEVVVPDRFVQIPALIDAHAPAVIVLDLNMPTLTGEQIGKFLKRHEYTGRIVVYSGEPPEKAGEAARNIGAHACISKEAPLEALLAAVQGGMPVTAH